MTHPCISSSLWVKVILAIGNHKNTENKRLSIWQLCRHWWHRKLSLWQLTVPPVTTTLSNWRSFVFSEYSNKGLLPSTVLWLAHCINSTLLVCCRLTLWMLLLQEIDEFERGLSGVDHNIRHHPYSSSIVKFDDQRGLFYKRSLHFGIKNLKQYLRMNTYSKW